MPEWLKGLYGPSRIAFAVGILVALITLMLPNQYRSEVRLLPVETKSSGVIGSLASAAAAVGMAVPGGDSGDANIPDILQSRTLQEALLQTRFQFRMKPWILLKERQRDQTLFEYLDEKNLDRAVRALGKIVNVNRDLKSKVIFITIETRSPELSQKVATTYVQLLENYLKVRSMTRGGYKASFASARLREAREDLLGSEREFKDFLERNRNYQTTLDPSIRLHGTRLEAEMRLRQQLVTTLAMNYEQALLEKSNDMPILNVLDPGNLAWEKSGPARSKIVLTLALLAGLTVILVDHREWLVSRILKGL